MFAFKNSLLLYTYSIMQIRFIYMQCSKSLAGVHIKG